MNPPNLYSLRSRRPSAVHTVHGHLDRLFQHAVLRQLQQHGEPKVDVFVAGCAVLQKTCAGAFFKLCQNILLTSSLRSQKILLAGSSGDIYGPFLLVTFFVSRYFGIWRYIEISKSSRDGVVIGRFGPEKLGIWSEFFINTKVKISKRPFRWY